MSRSATSHLFASLPAAVLFTALLASALPFGAPASGAPTEALSGCVNGVKVGWLRSEGKGATPHTADVAVAGDGAVYFAATLTPRSKTASVGTVSKYGAAGKRAWITRLPGIGKAGVQIAGVAPAAEGLYAFGNAGSRMFLALLDKAGTVTANRRLGKGSAVAVAAAQGGIVYLLMDQGDSRVLARYKDQGKTLEWREAINSNPVRLAVDSAGAVYLTSYYDSMLEKRNPRDLEWDSTPDYSFDTGVDVYQRGDRIAVLYRWQTDNSIIYPAVQEFAPDAKTGAHYWWRSRFAPLRLAIDTKGRTWVVGFEDRHGAVFVKGSRGDSYRLFDVKRGLHVSLTAVSPGLTGAAFVAGWTDAPALQDKQLEGPMLLMRMVPC